MEIKPFDNYQKTKSDCESIRITEEIKKKNRIIWEFKELWQVYSWKRVQRVLNLTTQGEYTWEDNPTSQE